MHLLTLGSALALFWLALSGHYSPLLLSLGAVSVALVVWLSHRMDIVDHEGVPVHIGRRAPGYWLWLGWQILLSAWDVSRRIWMPGPTIRPAVRTTPAAGLSELALATYANSITLTPGTLSLAVTAEHIDIHALDDRLISDLDSGGMLARVRGLDAS